MRNLNSIDIGQEASHGTSLPDDAARSADCHTNAFLLANNKVYKWLLDKALATGTSFSEDGILERISAAAGFAAAFHTGRFADGLIENLALDIGRRLDATGGASTAQAGPTGEGRRRILHLASHMVGIAGHSRMVKHWIQADRNSVHSLCITQQNHEVVPDWLSEEVARSGGRLVVLPTELTITEKAKLVRNAARATADLVVLHHDGHDVVPTVAFATSDCPPVAVLNHADHQFWLGSSIADMVINLRTIACEHTVSRRFVDLNVVLPVPLSDDPPSVSRNRARNALGIPEDQIVLLSVGRAEKYRPCSHYDFTATARKILDRNLLAHLYVVGETLQGLAPYLRSSLHDRLHFVGPVDDAKLYRASADVYLESFPFGSQTALLEAALSGLPVVPAYAPLFPLLVANDDAVTDLLPNPADEDEYADKVSALVENPIQRKRQGTCLRRRLLVDHVGDGWRHRLDDIYRVTDQLRHRPREIPLTSCNSTSYSDVGLSLWRVVADGRNFSLGPPGDIELAVLSHHAYVARVAGDFRTARSYAWRALIRKPYRPKAWRLLGVAMLGKTAGLIRLMMDRVKNIRKPEIRLS